MTAAAKGADELRRKDGRRVEKSLHIEDKEIVLGSWNRQDLQSLRRGGEIGIGELTDTGEPEFIPLSRIRTHRIRDKGGLFRWYNDYRLPEGHGGETVTVRLHNNEQDADRKLNRPRTCDRFLPPTRTSQPSTRRNDSESINRDLDDSMWLGRAHGIGHARQHLNLIGNALVVNSLTRYEHRQRPPSLASAA